MVPHRAHLYNSFSDGGLHSLQQAIYLPSTAKGISSLCSIVCSLLFAQESVYLILLQWKSLCLKYSLCYPSCALFSAPSRAVITYNGAPPSAPVYFLFKSLYTSFCCWENFFLYKIFFVLPIVCTFFLPHRVHLLLWMVPRRVHLFTFYSKVSIPHFAAKKFHFV